MNIKELLSNKVLLAMAAAGIPSEFSAHVAQSKKAGFGDYQANGAMAAAKAMKTNPRALAQSIIEHLQLDDIAEKVEVAGPGFINIHLSPTWLAKQGVNAANDRRLNIPASDNPQKVVADYSSPNLAKEMHVGHLRSTIIGDAIARVLTFMGDDVIRQNHVGDWGTQFGMLIAELEDQLTDGEQAEFALKDLEAFYQQSKKHFDASEDFANKARDYVVKLQSGDEKILALWKKFREVSLSHNEEIYQLLNVTLKMDDVCGESFYNDDLATLVNELKNSGLATEDDGAQLVFLDELADKEGNPSPVLIQKKDGGFLYATTDLAAMRYRSGELNADRLMYFIDDRQSLHMKQVFVLGKKAGFVRPEVSLEHHAFGKMLGQDGKPFKTRTGGTVKLADLITEAIQRANAVVADKNPELSEQERAQVARKVGVGAVKYADLSKTRTNDYIFNWEAMLSFEGNTGPYMQYAYTRIVSIFRKAEIELHTHNAPIDASEDAEKTLLLKALQFAEVIELVANDALPHALCNYLFDLASAFSSFYEACPILKDDIDAPVKASRLQLCKLVANTLHTGLDLLGIETMERM